jgi:hypothetical protein
MTVSGTTPQLPIKDGLTMAFPGSSSMATKASWYSWGGSASGRHSPRTKLTLRKRSLGSVGPHLPHFAAFFKASSWSSAFPTSSAACLLLGFLTCCRYSRSHASPGGSDGSCASNDETLSDELQRSKMWSLKEVFRLLEGIFFRAWDQRSTAVRLCVVCKLLNLKNTK